MKILKYADGGSSRPTEAYVIKNSETIFIGGTVKLVAGAIEPADAATDLIYGLCDGFIGKASNTPIEHLTTAETADVVYTKGEKVVVHSDNETVAEIRALVTPLLPNDVVEGDADADLATGTVATIGNYVNIDTADERKFKKSTGSASIEQFLIVDHPGTARGIRAKLVEGQIFGQ